VLVERDEQAPDKFLVPPRRRGGHEAPRRWAPGAHRRPGVRS